MLKLSVLDQSRVSSGSTHREALQQTLALAKAVDGWGYSRYWVAEHHNTIGLAGSSPEVLMSTIAANTKYIRVGSGGVLLPHYSAYKVAENFRMLEALYPGRIDLGIGRAPGGMPNTSRALRDGLVSGLEYYPQQLSELSKFLTDTIEPGHRWEGIKASPQISTVPQVWLLGSSDQSAIYAAQIGAGFNFAHFINGSGGMEFVHQYQQEFQPSILGQKPQAMAAILVLCAETESEAEQLAASIDLLILKREKGESGNIPSTEEAMDYPYSMSDRIRVRENRSRMIVGNPQQVKEQLLHFSEAYGIEEVMVLTYTHDFKARFRSYELLAEQFKL